MIKLVLFSLLLSVGQLLFKKAALSSFKLNTLENVALLIFNLWFILALIFYGLATLLWMVILQSTPLTIAYLFVALGFIFIPLASSIVFGERLDMNYLFGSLLIMIGIIIAGSNYLTK